jgi:hypothetical protein
MADGRQANALVASGIGTHDFLDEVSPQTEQDGKDQGRQQRRYKPEF